MNLLIQPLPGYDTQISHLAAILLNARESTLAVVRGLSTRDLDYQLDDKANSIGSLLMHIGALEYFTQFHIFKDVSFDPAEAMIWHNGLAENLPKKLIRGNDLNYYLKSLEKVRALTLSKLATLRDPWLYEQFEIGPNSYMNNYFKLFHLCEDEMNHCGQIKWLKKRL